MRTHYQDYAPKSTRYMSWAPVVGGPKRWEELHGVVTVLKEEEEIDLELFAETNYLKELRQLRVKARPPLERNATVMANYGRRKTAILATSTILASSMALMYATLDLAASDEPRVYMGLSVVVVFSGVLLLATSKSGTL